MRPIAACGTSRRGISTSIRATPPCSTACGRRGGCPSSRTSGRGKRSCTPPTAPPSRWSSSWHLPDLRTLRVVTTPNPDGGVTYLFDDVTERLNLERRFDAMIRVQRETLDNLSEAVAVFGSDGRVRLFNPEFATMWGLAPALLDQHPHIEAVIASCRSLHAEETTWQTLRMAVTALDDRTPRTLRIDAYRQLRRRLRHRAPPGRRDARHLPRRHRRR